MNNKFYTDKETSKQLKDWGCDIESEMWLIKGADKEHGCWGLKHFDDLQEIIGSDEEGHWTWLEEAKYRKHAYQTYHLLEDVCVKYAKEFFGEEYSDHLELDFSDCHSNSIIEFLRQNKIKEANEDLLANTVFNPLNK